VHLPDANVLLYAVNESAPDHAAALRWLDGALNGQRAVGFAWVVLLAFLRLSTHRAVFERPLTAEQALGVIRDWLGQPPAVVISPTARHIDVLAGLLAETGTAANLVNDAHLATLAVEHDAVLISYDADFGRFRGLRWERPAAR
jgi:toxin-antitoxin system PIN domain toxin